jgi:hypothetical protein
LAHRKVKIYSVGQKSSLLPDSVLEMDFEGDCVSDLLKSIGRGGNTLYHEVVQEDGSFGHGYALALNGEIIRCEELDSKEIPNSSDFVVIHLLQIPAGG